MAYKYTLNEENLCDLVFKKKWYRERRNETIEKKLDDKEIIKRLSIRLEGNDITTSTREFLEHKNENEALFYADMWKEIYPCKHMNPHVKDNPYREYFVDNINGQQLSHIKKFNDLLELDEDDELKIKKKYRDQVIFHLGTKGSGKTLWQNVWLFNNNIKFEENNIFWVRLDVEKLYKIWDKFYISYISTEEYILGQMLYVICKHYQNREGIKSSFIEKIINEFSNSSENIIQGIPLTKKDKEDVGDDDDVLYNYCNKKGIDKNITNVLEYFEKWIAKYENLIVGKDSRRLIAPDREKSFFIDKVLENRNSSLFKVWMHVARKIYDFILENNYFILILIDGADNFTFHMNQQNLLKETFKQLCENHLKNTDQNIITIISLRDYMFSFLEEYYMKNYVPFRDSRYLDHIIRQQETNLGEEIFTKRINYLKNKNAPVNTIITKVLDELKNNHNVDDKKWNANYRSFFANHFSLAKYIAFKYYWRPKNQVINIKDEIKRYEHINFLLNGELFLSEEHFKQNEDFGVNCFNLFDCEHDKYDIFIYIRLLLIVRNSDKISSTIIENILKLFGVKEAITKSCIDKLVDTGLIQQSFEYKEKTKKGIFLYSISDKGRHAIDECISDIHFLYYLSLDTYIPISLLEHIIVAPNNVGINEKRKYPIACIISGLTFLNYLVFKNKSDLRKIEEKKISQFNIKKSIFDLPINRDNLKKSVSIMLEIINNDESYAKEFNNWGNSFNSRI